MSALERRAQLIEVSRGIFAERGFDAASIEEIAAAAKISKPVVYEHFGGKEGLYAEVLNEQFADLRRTTEIKIMDADPLKKFELYVRATVARYRKNPYLLRFYTSELTNPTPCFETIVKPAIMGVLSILQETFTEGLTHEQFREGLDPSDTVMALAGMINFYFLLEPASAELVDHAQERDEELIRHIMDIFTRGILKA